MKRPTRTAESVIVAVGLSLLAGCNTTGTGYNPYLYQPQVAVPAFGAQPPPATINHVYNPYVYQPQATVPAIGARQQPTASPGYQHGWKVYERPQPGYTYRGAELNPYGPGGSKSYGPGGGRSYGPGGGMSYGPGGGMSYGPGGGRNPSNPWTVAQ